MSKTAFITGITGQDGSFLAEFLLKKGYQVVGLISKEHDIGLQNIEKIKNELKLEIGDLLDTSSLKKIITKYKPKEIYNLGGVTFVPLSWENPELTFNVNGLGVIRLLKLIKDYSSKTRFFQATSAKIFGDPKTGPQNENYPIQPNSPYGVSKACGHFLTQNFRNHYGLFACSGIMYNHESEKRGPEFVTRKITLTAAKIKLGKAEKLVLGDLEAKQDWGYAPDYIEAMWLMLQQDKPQDYVIATQEQHSVKEFCKLVFDYLGLDWQKYTQQNKTFIRKEISHNFFGDIAKARKILRWKPKVNFKMMIKIMTEHDLNLVKKGVS